MTTGKLADAAVTTPKLAEHAVVGDKVAHGTLTDVNVAAANKDGLAGVPSLRTLGSGAQQAMPGNATPGGPPSGPAGGDLAGTYPNPSIAPGTVTDAEVAAANKDGSAGVPSLRTLGSGAQQAMPGNATPGGPPTGAAGGALAGTYPNPSLDVSGGPCANGEALTDVSALAALTCAPGVYSDGSGNVAAGPTSFPALTIGSENSSLGDGALLSNTTGDRNTAVGIGALGSNTTATNNSALGAQALASNTTGDGNSALGELALLDNTTGKGNSALGLVALSSNTTGIQNSALGIGALGSNTTGNSNLALGDNAGSNLTTGDNNIAIAHPGGFGGESNTTRIGFVQTRAFIAGIRGVTTGNADAVPVLIDSAGQLGTASSSRGDKRDIRPLGALRALMRLRPVSFRYRTGPPELHYGLIAEQVARVLPELAVPGPDGLPETVQYQELPVLLLNELQEQRRQNRTLRARVDRQQAQIDWLLGQVKGR